MASPRHKRQVASEMLTERVARGSAHPNECVAAVVVKLEDDAVALLVKTAGEQARSVFQVARQIFRDYQFGLKLIQKNTNQKEFVLTEAAVEDPDKFLSELVVQSYKDA